MKTSGKGAAKKLVSWSLRPGRVYRSCACQHRIDYIAPIQTEQRSWQA